LKSGVYQNIEQLKGFNQKQTEEIFPNFANENVKVGYKSWRQKITQFQ
jgi:hypothetical protein